jgi:hypothetical protein
MGVFMRETPVAIDGVTSFLLEAPIVVLHIAIRSPTHSLVALYQLLKPSLHQLRRRQEHPVVRSGGFAVDVTHFFRIRSRS